jgi:hypothetical protein
MGKSGLPGGVRVMWREGTWRCDSTMVDARPVLRLYDGEKLELEHEVMAAAVAVTAEAMRKSVLRYLSGGFDVAEIGRPRRGDTKAVGPGFVIFTICRECRSLRAYLRAKRSGKDWYFCPDCAHQWDVPSES